MRGVSIRLIEVMLAAFVFCFGLTAGATTTPSASGVKGYVKIAEDREIYVDYEKPIDGKPVIVLINGLTYRTGHWDALAQHLRGEGIGILRYDPEGMGLTLLRRGPATSAFKAEDQVKDVELLLQALRIKQPVHVVGLSYGGAIAMIYAAAFPERIASVTLMAPFVAPLAAQDLWIRLQIQQARLVFPYNPASYDELYDYFLRLNVYSTYPAAEPTILENPLKLEAVFRLVQGIRKFHAVRIAPKMPKGKLHLMVARKDQYIENAVHEEFWGKTSKQSRASLIYLEGTEHKIPEAAPQFAAAWILQIVKGNPLLTEGRTFVGSPREMTAVSDGTKIDLNKE